MTGIRLSGWILEGPGSRGGSAIGVIFALALLASPAVAIFPGASGEIAYRKPLDRDPGIYAIFGSASGQLSFPFEGSSDRDVAWAPDGKRIAFTRSHPDQVRDHSIGIVNLEPYDSRELIAATAFNLPGAPPLARIYQPTWSPDGVWIAFVVQYYGSTSPDPYSGLWKIRAADGTGLQQLANVKHFSSVSDPFDNTAANPEWSPDGQSIVYDCASTRLVGVQWSFLHDLCVYDVATGGVRQINVDWPGRSIRLAAGGPRWTPDGKTILFSLMGTAPPVNGRSTTYSHVFTARPDGTALSPLTQSESTCARSSFGVAEPTFAYRSAVPSPDGESVLAMVRKTVPIGLVPGSTDGRCTAEVTDDLGSVPIRGGAPSQILKNPDPTTWDVDLDWQSIPSGLIVHVDDGHGNSLRGLKVELFDAKAAHAPIPGKFRNELGGSYAFDAPLAPGDYVVRATLVDDDFKEPFPSAFDVRSYPVLPAPPPAGPDTAWAPIWLEKRITVAGGTIGTRENLSFDGADLQASNASAADIEAGRLDDLAHLYFRIRQLVDWAHAELYLADTIPTVSFWAFATTDSGLDPDECCAIPPHQAYYRPSNRAIAMGTDLSKFESRDGFSNGPGESDDAPENGEWHEYTHHLYSNSVAIGSCFDESGQPQPNHGGYSNSDTCDSMQEGFASFLPAWASRSIEGTTDSAYGRFLDLEWHTKAWSHRVGRSSGKRYSTEDFAVAALFWDLVDTESDAEPTVLVGRDGEARIVSYMDDVSIPLDSLWRQIRGFTGAGETVDQLRLSFGGSTPTIDLDGDGALDVRPFDVPFLMHGFFPIDTEQQLSIGQVAPRYRYRVGYAIGRSDHHEFDPSGLALLRTLSPRSRTPRSEGANLGIAVRDASDRAISGATIELTTQFPDMPLPRVSSHPLAGAAGSVHLELPTYFDHLLPEGAPLPPCDPANDVEIEVTLVARRNGYTSTNSHALGNCTYQQAIAAAVGDDAIAYTLTFPDDAAPPATTAAVAGAPVAVNNVTTGTFEVTFACDDPVVGGFASGCIRTEYRIDGGPIAIYDRPLRLPPPVQLFEYRSVDAAGNVEPFQEAHFDSDADGISDAVEMQQGTNPLAADSDGDASSDAADNCPVIANADQLDTDADSLGDVCDDDDDGDGLSDASELAGGTDPLDPDTDGDRLPDPDELTLGTSPIDADSDDDILVDGDEIARATNPLDPDSDDDGLQDGDEVVRGTSPLDSDSDDDGIEDAVDNCALLANPGQEDLDDDAVGDLCDPSLGSRWKLIGVTDDSRFANVQETLFELDTSNASATFVMTLGNGGIGEAIAFNPDDGLLYHGSGTVDGDKVWESIDVTTRTIRTSGPLTTPSGSQVGAMTFNPATGRFLVSDTSGELFDTTLTGSATSIGGVDRPKGLAFVGDALYAASLADESLYRVDPNTGDWISDVAVDLTGVSIRGLGGLATHPETGALWIIINRPGDTQYLATVDPVTGVATSVGVLPDGFAGIAFVPEPSSLLSLSTGAVALAYFATRRRRRRRCGSPEPVARPSSERGIRGVARMREHAVSPPPASPALTPTSRSTPTGARRPA